jgi:REP element-mobilizing transposase RayT
MAGIIREKKNKPIIINGAGDHVHLFFGLHPANSISDLVRDIKSGSANFIHRERFIRSYFSWQEGYGAFSYAHSQIDSVYQYISRQEEHHKGKTFREEYLEILKKSEVGYDDQYLFDWLQ